MYRQILLDPKDRHFQYIVWRESPTDDLQCFRLNTVTYGTASAPFLATRCLKFLADIHRESAPQYASIIENDFYVDDLLTGGETEEDIRNIREGVQKILEEAHFPLRKWYSNHSEFLEAIPSEIREKTIRMDDSDCIKTLGLVWEPSADEFQFRYQFTSSSSRVTKRTVLADLARLFDPLGLINPVVVKAKVFLQELWILNLAWDESIPLEFEHRWKSFRNQFLEFNNIKVPRYVVAKSKFTQYEIHGFSDASERAYGCCIYIRCADDAENILVNLLCAKSRVAPIRVVRSLPCLELCAAELLAQLWDKIRASLPMSLTQIVFWTDSEIVLDWLSHHPSQWKTYVGNRVSKVQELTTDGKWRHVKSHWNPADIISRGASILGLKESIWFGGPDFLRHSADLWPEVRKRHTPAMELPEHWLWNPTFDVQSTIK